MSQHQKALSTVPGTQEPAGTWGSSCNCSGQLILPNAGQRLRRPVFQSQVICKLTEGPLSMLSFFNPHFLVYETKQ